METENNQHQIRNDKYIYVLWSFLLGEMVCEPENPRHNKNVFLLMLLTAWHGIWTWWFAHEQKHIINYNFWWQCSGVLRRIVMEIDSYLLFCYRLTKDYLDGLITKEYYCWSWHMAWVIYIIYSCSIFKHQTIDKTWTITHQFKYSLFSIFKYFLAVHFPLVQNLCHFYPFTC